MASAKQVYKIELPGDLTVEQAAQVAAERLRQEGRQAEVTKKGFAPAILVDGALYQLAVASAAGSGIGVPCAVLREL